MALPPSTANWHWKNKDVTPWAKGWFERELTTIKVSDGDNNTAVVASVTEVEGDVELGQRKSKLITIFDCKIVLKWSGTTADGTDVEGTLTIPEVSHEVTVDKLSDYAYEWSLTTTRSPAVDAVFHMAKSGFPIALEEKFEEFASAIIETHGKDLTVSSEPSRVGTPAPASAQTASSAAVAGATAQLSATNEPKAVKSEAKKINTSTVTVEATFAASADDLYGLLTDEQRIPMWTRAPAQSKAEPGGEFSLFGGGVKGEYVSLDRPKMIAQSWALQSPTWPSGHKASLMIKLVQSDDSTKVTLSLVGVPKGLEDEIKHNLEGYYIQGLKSIGLGTIL
ncbi:hypothetical protein BD410DRAFT_785430 [Rickenella mellea]|uniref:Activator of Hsp90 ATPase AHSA1-like N-terminal domain-containing protein n=1 Tax=Rickenella mellea TaxID=50990 RepID=A0A4Y7QD01_9AGAM|nr:hypothetical protein BD410DRAFT_785430 [Rickenella mellea]